MDPQTILTTLLAAIPVRDVVYLAALCGLCAALMPWLPVPARASSPYGRLYAVLNLLGQNFRNVANATRPGAVSAAKES